MPLAEPAPNSRRLNGAPVSRMPLIGRERELETLRDLLIERHVPIVTLTGPGGVGKTRLATQVIADLGREFVDGAAFVALAALTDAKLVLPTIAQVVGIRSTEGRPVDEALAEYFADREYLLVLDNIEQVVEASPEIAQLAQSAPRLTILATSRGPLKVRGEFEVAVPSLSLPQEMSRRRSSRVGQLAESEAVQLFLQRANAIDPQFTLTDSNAATIAEICVKLDGLPLAIELAAARCRLLSPEVILARLANRLSLLTGGGRDAPLRQQTLRNAIQWSVDLLSAREQELFCRLAVFAGEFTLEAAETIVEQAQRAETVQSRADVNSASTLDGLAALADHSLVRRVEGPANESRVVMLETIREFAAEMLTASGNETTTRVAHADFYLDLLLHGQAGGKGEEDPEWIESVERDLDNVRAAMSWFLDQGDVERLLQMIVAVAPLWSARGYLVEGRRWVERAVGLSGGRHAPGLPAVLRIGSWLASYQGDGQRALEFAEQAQALAREHGDAATLTKVLKAMGVVHFYRGEMDDARRYWEEALSLIRSEETPQPDQEAGIMINLGVVAVVQTDVDRAEDHLRRALDLSGNGEHGLMGAIAAMHLADLACERGDFATAIDYARRSLTISRELKHTLGMLSSVVTIAVIASRLEQDAVATRLLASADAVREDAGYALGIVGTDEYRRIRENLRGRLGEPVFNEIWEDGQSLTLGDAVNEANEILHRLEVADHSSLKRETTIPSDTSSLTMREREVVLLIADGKTNQEIADALHISLRTAQTHVANILGKLDLNSRTAVAAYAVRRGLV
jgi:predicted ATPase/DNA-binding CsgD family transcriptional regulator